MSLVFEVNQTAQDILPGIQDHIGKHNIAHRTPSISRTASQPHLVGQQAEHIFSHFHNTTVRQLARIHNSDPLTPVVLSKTAVMLSPLGPVISWTFPPLNGKRII